MTGKQLALSNIWKYVGYGAMVVFLLFLALPTFPRLTISLTPFFAHAEVTLCSHTSDKSACYERNVPRLLWIMPVENIFSIVRGIQEEDMSYRFCHVLAHNLGQNELKRDPDAWVSLMHKNPPDGICSNGYIHGVIVGRFHTAELSPEQIDRVVPDLTRACEPAADWNPTNLDKAMCYHGMGHVLTFITGADMPRAVSYCKRIAVKSGDEDYSETCISGVFMQIFQPLEPEDFELIEKLPVRPTRDTLAQFCGAYATEEERSLCFGEGWPLFRDNLKSAEGVQAFCSTVKDTATQTNCYRTALTIGARMSLGQPDKQATLCGALPRKLGETCFGILAEAFVEEDRSQGTAAATVCARAPHEYQDSCFGYLVDLITFTFGNDQTNKNRFCAALPDAWREQCAKK